jgi:Gas vesicle synthesis protein GvpL/GvpF
VNSPLTYVYCAVAASRRPSLAGAPGGLPKASKVRLLEAEHALYLAVADVPSREYGEEAINRKLADLDWVSRAAVAHEAVVECFIGATAVLPMKLFTIFTNDARALAHMQANHARIAATVKRVGNHDEFGVRVVLDRARAIAGGRRKNAPPRTSGAAYLTRKKAQRDAAVELAERARETVAELYDRLAARARQARRRPASELPVPDGPLLLDAAFLVARSRARTFRALAAREARALEKSGYGLTLTGPWPPYTFVQDA